MNPEELSAEPIGYWRFDKRVPIAVILMLGVQTAGAVWWASSIASRVSALESFAVDVGQRRTQRDLVQLDLAGRIIKLETIGTYTDNQLRSINSKLDRILEGKTP